MWVTDNILHGGTFDNLVAAMVESGICNPEIREKLWPDLLSLFAQDQAEQPTVAELPFPSSNPWILKQVALWLTLGKIPGLTHSSFCREHVRQGGEQAGYNKQEVVYHYFGIDKAAFLSEITTNLGW